MGKLTDSQLIVLAAAVARDDGAASVPARIAAENQIEPVGTEAARAGTRA